MRRSILSAGLGLALLATTVGCASEPDQRADPAPTTAGTDPTIVLASSTDHLAQESFRFEMTMGEVMSATGAMDPAAERGSVTMSITVQGTEMTMEIVTAESDMWADLGEFGAVLGAEAGWMHIDASRLSEDGILGMAPGRADLAGAAQMLEHLGEVEQVDDTTYRGQIDVTQSNSAVFDDEIVAELGGAASALDFVATVDEQGRLSTLEIMFPELPDFPADSLQIRYFDFGAPVEVTEPPADQVSELPEDLYELFAS